MTAGGQRGCLRSEEREGDCWGAEVRGCLRREEREGDCWRAEGMPEEGREGG